VGSAEREYLNMQQEIVVIKHGGRVYRGPVKSKANYPIRKGQPYDMGKQTYGEDHPNNWYVEFTHDDKSAARTGDPGYVKQIPDGVSSVEFVKEEA
jgi:hypothetical protein